MAIARPIDRRLFFLLDRTHMQLSKAAEAHLKLTSPMSTAQAAVLIYLGYHDRCSLSELAKGVGRNNPAVTGLITRMEKAGLVARIDDTHDRRSKAVILTDAGWQSREVVMNSFRDFNTKLAKTMTQNEIETVLKFLDLAVKNIKG